MATGSVFDVESALTPERVNITAGTGISITRLDVFKMGNLLFFTGYAEVGNTAISGKDYTIFTLPSGAVPLGIRRLTVCFKYNGSIRPDGMVNIESNGNVKTAFGSGTIDANSSISFYGSSVVLN